MKKVSEIFDINNLLNQKKDFDDNIINIIDIIKQETGIDLDQKNILINKNTIKIKTNSDIRFIIFLNINNIKLKIKKLNIFLNIEL